MSFRITGLPAAEFSGLFALADEDLARRRAVRQVSGGGDPCRISLTDSRPGDEVILINYVSHPVETPYRTSYAIYVRRGEETYDAVDAVPEQLRRRMLSVRAFDASGMIVTAELLDGRELATVAEKLLADRRVACLHAHFATFGCYAARIGRA